MATSKCPKESINEIGTNQAAHRHSPNYRAKAKRATLLLSRVTTWPYRVIRQTWGDYQDGRSLRKYMTQDRDPEVKDGHPREAEDEIQKPQDRSEVLVITTEGLLISEYYHGNRRARPRPVIENWVHQEGEWPWRNEQVVHRDSSENVRGIWVLEAKDLDAIYLETKDRPGRRDRATVPQAQWPVPRQGKTEDGANSSTVRKRDELMEWLRQW